jgi:hypothetical protein
MTELDVRVECVRLAISIAPDGGTPQDIVAIAKALLTFISGQQDS